MSVKYAIKNEQIILNGQPVQVSVNGRPVRVAVRGVPRVDYADRFVMMLKECKDLDRFGPYEREYRFAAYAVGGPGRGLRERLERAGFHDWRFDVAWIGHKVAVEVDGGNRMAGINPRNGTPVAIGRHTLDGDYAKRNTAVLLGWRVLFYTLDMLRSGDWQDELRIILSDK